MLGFKNKKKLKEKMMALIEEGKYDEAQKIASIIGESDRCVAEFLKAVGGPIAQAGVGAASIAVHHKLVTTGYQLEESGVAFTSATLRGVGPAKKP